MTFQLCDAHSVLDFQLLQQLCTVSGTDQEALVSLNSSSHVSEDATH